jgi:hypothetical protein
MDRREAISEEKKHFLAQDSIFYSHEKPYKAICLGCK